MAPDGRIHATFNQTVARTGRLSSDQPNLHNIPVRSDEGRQFRRAFVPAPGRTLLVADYNQIELRCIAHLAEDPGLIAAFTSREDIHTATASRIFSVEPGAVTHAQRSKAKMVSYGLAYGMEAYGLGQRLNIPTDEATEILDAYFVAFPSVKAYMERTVNAARERGYTETLFGRRRPIPELSSFNFRIRQAGERQAMNAGIQGLAADIFKVALIRLDRALEEGGFASRLTLQVHDEVLVEVDPAEEDAVGELTQATLRGRPSSASRSRSTSPSGPAGPTPRADGVGGGPSNGRKLGLRVPSRAPSGLTSRRRVCATGRLGPVPEPEPPEPSPTTGSSRWPTTSAPPTSATRSPRARCRRSTSSSSTSGSYPASASSTSAAAPAATPTSWPAGASSSTASTSASASSPSPGPRPARRHLRAPRRPRPAVRPASSTPPSASVRARSAWSPGRGRTRPCSPGWPARCKPGGRVAVSAFNAYFAVKYQTDGAFDAATGINHEWTEVRDEAGAVKAVELWTGCFTPRELRAIVAATGLQLDALYSVEPGRYRPDPATTEIARVPRPGPPLDVGGTSPDRC